VDKYVAMPSHVLESTGSDFDLQTGNTYAAFSRIYLNTPGKFWATATSTHSLPIHCPLINQPDTAVTQNVNKQKFIAMFQAPAAQQLKPSLFCDVTYLLTSAMVQSPS